MQTQALPPHVQAVLGLLERVSYVLECLAADLRGEGKSALMDLLDAFKAGVYLHFEGAGAAAADLAEVLHRLREHDERVAAIKLGALSRRLWHVAQRAGV